MGGKWTTYRKMAEDVINIAAKKKHLPIKECITKDLAIHGCTEVDFSVNNYYYGTDSGSVDTLMQENNSYRELLHPSLSYRRGDIIWAVRNEYCMTVEDALLRRTRSLLLDAKAAIEAAPAVAQLMAAELKKGNDWIQQQEESFLQVAKNYLSVSNLKSQTSSI